MRMIVFCTLVCLLAFSCEEKGDLTHVDTSLFDQLFSESGEDHDFTVGYDVLQSPVPGSELRERSLFFTTENVLSNYTLRGSTAALVVHINGTENEISALDTDLTNNNQVEALFFDELDLENNTASEGFSTFRAGSLRLEIDNSGASTVIIELTHPEDGELTFRWSGLLQSANTLF